MAYLGNKNVQEERKWAARTGGGQRRPGLQTARAGMLAAIPADDRPPELPLAPPTFALLPKVTQQTPPTFALLPKVMPRKIARRVPQARRLSH